MKVDCIAYRFAAAVVSPVGTRLMHDNDVTKQLPSDHASVGDRLANFQHLTLLGSLIAFSFESEVYELT